MMPVWCARMHVDDGSVVTQKLDEEEEDIDLDYRWLIFRDGQGCVTDICYYSSVSEEDARENVISRRIGLLRDNARKRGMTEEQIQNIEKYFPIPTVPIDRRPAYLGD